MKFAFIRAEDEKKTSPVVPMCRVLEVSTSGYYAWLHREPSEQSQRKAELTAKVKAAHEDSRGSHGSPRVTKKLNESGEKVSEKTVAKIMQEQELAARKKRRFKATPNSKHEERIADNLLQRATIIGVRAADTFSRSVHARVPRCVVLSRVTREDRNPGPFLGRSGPATTRSNGPGHPLNLHESRISLPCSCR